MKREAKPQGLRVYTGYRVTAGDCRVMVDGAPLRPGPSQKIWNHSPDGFEWGYGGSGPAQLALAILLDVTGNKELSARLHQPFKWAYVAKWASEWRIDSTEVEAWVAAQQAYKA